MLQASYPVIILTFRLTNPKSYNFNIETHILLFNHHITMAEARIAASDQKPQNTQKNSEPDASSESSKPKDDKKKQKDSNKDSKKDSEEGDPSSSGAWLAPTHLPGMRFSGM